MGRVLIIDDDEQVLLTLSEVVETLGHSVRTAGNGREGLNLFENEPFDCVITDLAMPLVDGLEVLQHVKRSKPRIGVLIITGNSTVELLAASVNMGADAYVTKPFKIREIDEQLGRIVARNEQISQRHDPRAADASSFRRVIAARIPLGWALVMAGGLAAAVHLASRWL